MVLSPLPRVVCRFSCGAASAVATKLALKKYGKDRVVVTYSDPGSESSDNPRFLRDCEQWLGVKILTLPKGKYADTWAVWEGERFITSHAGAPCTGFLKRQPAMAFARPDDITVFGYTADPPDIARAKRLRQSNFEISIETPLIDAGLTKSDCLAMVERAAIALPEMYVLGYHNNNCVGCCKAGMGYWNKIRVDFPQIFKKMAALQRRLGLGSAFWREADGTPIMLDNLDPARGNFDNEPRGECSLMCHLAEMDISE